MSNNFVWKLSYAKKSNFVSKNRPKNKLNPEIRLILHTLEILMNKRRDIVKFSTVKGSRKMLPDVARNMASVSWKPGIIFLLTSGTRVNYDRYKWFRIALVDNR